MSDIRICYVTAGSREEALRVGRALVEERLAACVNILGPITSVYQWEDAIQEDGEVAFIAKTRAALVPRLAERVRALHSYDVPCVVALAVDGGEPGFLAWIAEETAGPGRG